MALDPSQDLARQILGQDSSLSDLAGQALSAYGNRQTDLASAARAALARLNPANASPDLRLARNDTGPVPQSVLDVAMGGLNGGPGTTNAPPVGVGGAHAAPTATGPSTYDQLAGLGKTPPAAATPPSAGPVGGGPESPATTPLDVIRATQAELGAGTPGTSSSGASRTTTKGTPFTPEQRTEMAESQRRFDERVSAIEDTRQAQYADQLGTMRAREVALADQRQHQADLETQRQAIVDQRTAAHQAALQDYMQGEPPKPFGGNWAAGLLATIGQALGAYGAAKTGSPNFAMQLVNGYLDREQKRWEAQQLQKRFGVESLAQLTQQARDEFRDAKTDRMMTERMIVDAEAQRFQAMDRNGDKAQALQLLRAENGKAYDNLRLQMEREAQDRVTIATHSTSTGGTPPQRASVLDAAESAIKRGILTRDQAQTGIGMAGVGPDAEGRTAAEQRIKGPSETVLEGFDRFGPAMGMKRNKDGSWSEPSLASIALARTPGTDEYNARKGMIHALAPEIATVRKNGAAATEPEIKSTIEELSTLSPQQLANTFNGVTERAVRTIRQRIYHGRNQIPGGNEGEQ